MSEACVYSWNGTSWDLQSGPGAPLCPTPTGSPKGPGDLTIPCPEGGGMVGCCGSSSTSCCESDEQEDLVVASLR
jgi:hypothetical protein